MPLCSEKVIIKDILIKVGHFKHLEKKTDLSSVNYLAVGAQA